MIIKFSYIMLWLVNDKIIIHSYKIYIKHIYLSKINSNETTLIIIINVFFFVYIANCLALINLANTIW